MRSATSTASATETAEPRPLGPLARLPVFALAGGVGALLLITSPFGARFFDEMYFVDTGHHLSWGYADQPWLVPALAGTLDSLFPHSGLALRLPSTLAAAAGVLVAALIARELGGRRTAQTLAAATYAVSGYLIPASHFLSTYVLDPFWWLLISWLVLRWVRLDHQGARDDRPLLWAGLVTAVALQTKFLVPLLWLGIAAGVLLVGPRRMLGRPLLWAGAAIAAACTVPTLLWQAGHDWPFLRFIGSVEEESDRALVAFGPVMFAGVLGTGFLVYALWRLARAPELRPYRFLGIAFAVVLIAILLIDGRSYYPSGLYGPLMAVAAVELERRNRWSWLPWVAWPGYLLSAAVAVWTVLYFISMMDAYAGRQPVEPIAAAYRSLPAETRARTAVVTSVYSGAASIDYHGPELGLPPAQSPHRGYWYLGAPPETADSILYVTTARDLRMFEPYFARYRFVGASPAFSLWFLEGRKQSWETIWPQVRSDRTID